MSRRVSPTATPHTRSWRGLADEAIEAKSRAAHGERAARIEAVAKSAATTPILVRRAITARLSLLRLEEAGVEVPDAVFGLPVGAADAIARWATRDPETAWRWAAAYAADEVSFARLISEERASRGAPVKAKTTSRVNRAEDPPAWRADQLARFARKTGRRVLPPAPEDLPVAAWAHGATSDKPVALLVIGPHPDLSAYVAERPTACVAAVGIATLVGRAIVIVPSDDVAVRYAAWLSERSVSSDDVGIETVEPPARRRVGKPRL